MQFPKSTPDLDHPIHKKRKASRKQSKQEREKLEIKHYQFKIQNPLKQLEQENSLPPQLQNQMKNLEYISGNSIKDIDFSRTSKRASSFEKNLLMMQRLAKKQEQKYCIMKQQSQSQIKSENEESYHAVPLNLYEDDKISLEINGFYDDEKDRIDDDFNIFKDNESEMDEENNDASICFYSNNELPAANNMDEQVNAYFGNTNE